MTDGKTRVLSIGECMVEFFRRDDGLWSQGFAGDTLNVAWALRALLPRTATVDYLTRIGSDALSDAMLGMLHDADIGTAHIARDPRRTLGLYTIQTDPKGERSFSYWRSDSAARGLAQDGTLLARALATTDLVYLSGITLAILPPDDRARLMTSLGPRGQRPFRLAFDPNIRPRLWPDKATSTAAITAMAALADILLPTHDDEAMAFGDDDAAATLARYAALGVPEIVVKDGTRPTLFHAGKASGACPVTPVPRPLDTTGAGDSFNGAYLAARLLAAPVDTAVRQGQQVSASVVGHRGALVPAAVLLQAASAAHL
jgi:2-dehydro-3-deoxygluconokinase